MKSEIKKEKSNKHKFMMQKIVSISFLKYVKTLSTNNHLSFAPNMAQLSVLT